MKIIITACCIAGFSIGYVATNLSYGKQVNKLTEEQASSSTSDHKKKRGYLFQTEGVIADFLEHKNKTEEIDIWRKLKNIREDELVSLIYDHTPEENASNEAIALNEMLYCRLAEKNPQLAMTTAFAQDKGANRIRGMKQTLSIWIANDPATAYKWFRDSEAALDLVGNDINTARHGHVARRSSGEHETLKCIFSTLALQDPEMAYQELIVLSELENKRRDSFKDANGNIVHDGMLLNTSEAAKALEGIATGLKEKKDYIQLLEKFSTDDKKDMEKIVILSWLRKDPKEAAEWYFENSQDKNEALSTMTSEMSNASLLGWMTSKKGAVDSEIVHYLKDAGASHPETSIRMALLIADETMQGKAIDAIVNEVQKYEHLSWVKKYIENWKSKNTSETNENVNQ